MTKELQLLEKIKKEPAIYCDCNSDIYTKYSFEIQAIEKALVDKDIQDVILNLIKQKGVEVGYLINCADLDAYNCSARNSKWSEELNEYQFRLLRRYFL